MFFFQKEAIVFPLLLPVMIRSLFCRVWAWYEVSCWLAPRDRISALSELLCSEFPLPTSMAGVTLMGQLVSSSIPCLSRKAVPSSQLPPHDANCEDHYSRQQEEWISQLNILLDYPANPFLWVRTALGLKSLKTKQHRSSNILKQGNGQPQGWWVKHCTGKERDASQPGCLHHS